MASSESYPEDLLYNAEHDWARIDGDEAVLGVTWFAVDSLGELVHYEPPAVGAAIARGSSYGEVESVKAVSDLIAPLSGEVLEANQVVVDAPGDGQPGSVRERLADPDPAQRPGRSRRAPRRRRVSRRARNPVSYLSLTEADREAMLAAIGIGSIEELFRDIPAGVRFGRALDVPPALSEAELTRHLEGLAAKNVLDGVSFLGAGIYDHYVPAVVDAVLQRGEFLTAYTPYQPELSQGVLQAIFEYQTAICELTGMDVSNASGYDGTTVAADACFLAKAATGRAKVVVTEATNPQVRRVIKTFARGFGLEIVEVPHQGGTTDPDRIRAAAGDAAAVIFQQPNFFGCLEPAPELAAAANERRRAPDRARRPDQPRSSRGAGELRLCTGNRRGPVRRQLHELRRPALRLPRRPRAVHPASARDGSSARR